MKRASTVSSEVNCTPSSNSGYHILRVADVNRWDEKAGVRRDAVRSQVIDALEAQKIKETGNEED